MGEYTRIIYDADDLLGHYRPGVLLSGPAAIDTCLRADAHDFNVGRIEGGNFRDPGFESRMDSIWAALRRPASRAEALSWNQSAAAFVSDQMTMSPDPDLPPADVFMLMLGQAPAQP